MKLELNNVLKTLDPISLKEMDRVKLQNRTDTKFVFNTNLLPIILNDIKIIQNQGYKNKEYISDYLDEENLIKILDKAINE